MSYIFGYASHNDFTQWSLRLELFNVVYYHLWLPDVINFATQINTYIARLKPNIPLNNGQKITVDKG